MESWSPWFRERLVVILLVWPPRLALTEGLGYGSVAPGFVLFLGWGFIALWVFFFITSVCLNYYLYIATVILQIPLSSRYYVN